MFLNLLMLVALSDGQLCGESGSYAMGDSVLVCVHFVESGTLQYKTSAELKLDKYSAITVSDTFTRYKNSSDVDILVQVGDKVSLAIPYSRSNLVAPLYSIVVRIDEGKVDELVWDNTCESCDACIKYGDDEVCAEDLCSDSKLNDCDPSIFVSWMGIDADGNYLTSAGFRLSQFRKYSLYSSYNSAKSDLT